MVDLFTNFDIKEVLFVIKISHTAEKRDSKRIMVKLLEYLESSGQEETLTTTSELATT